MKLRINLNTAVALAFTLALTGANAHACPTDPSVESQVQVVPEESRPGVLIMAHGGSDAWNQAVEQAVAPLRESYPIEIAYGMAKTSTMHAAINRLEDQGVNHIAVVRMFISGTSFLDKTEYILGLRHSLKETMHSEDSQGHDSTMSMPEKKPHKPMPMNTDSGAPSAPSSMDMGGHSMEAPVPVDSDSTFVLSTQGVSASTLIDDILVDRVRSLSVDPSTESILILAHGPGDDEENKQWLIDMQRRTGQLGEIGAFVDIQCETLREDWPGRRAQAEQRIREYVQAHNDAGNRVIVIPFRVAGFGPYAKVLEGLDYVADGQGFSPHPNMTAWIDQTARALLPSLTDGQASASAQE